MKKATILSGIDRLQLADEHLRGRRVGLMTNPTGMNRHLKSTIDIINERYNLTAMYAVEHGIRGDVQAGGKVETCVDPETGVTVFTAFGETSRFTDEMLDAFDVLVFDIQDVGARFYTYLYSLGYAMEACNRAGKSMVVLDRLNPIGGVKTGGTVLNPAFKSFVGDYELPTQYGLTIGEAARYIRDYQKLTLDLTVIPLEGWERGMYLDDTDLPWVAPSPNCATLNAALCYIGTCVFEGTNLSEGRGTTLPFEVIGAPFINGALLEKKMNGLGLPGVHFRRTSFCPTFSKHQGVLCHGVQMHVLDRETYDSFTDGLLLMDTIRSLYPEEFQFVRWGEKSPYSIDLLLGTDEYRTGALTAQGLMDKYAPKVREFVEAAKQYRLY